MSKLTKSFYVRDARKVAKDLLGKHIVIKNPDGDLITKIVETEAYLADEPSCHAFRGKTERNKVMFEDGGRVYVYFTYGNHWLLNFVTGKAGNGEAVLIRAVEPVKKVERMVDNRPKAKKVIDLTNGPGKLAQALGIDKSFYGFDLTGDKIFVEKGSGERLEIVTTTRIGINCAQELPYRYYIKGNKYVSRK